MDKISVIIPVYKTEKYLNRCVDSILKQTYYDFEIILVDDGSPDQCPQICDRLALQDDRIHVIHRVNGGLSAARNSGLNWIMEHSDSRWITFVDSDDWVHPLYLELLRAAVSNEGEISTCDFIKTNGDTPVVKESDMVVKRISPEEYWCNPKISATIACAKLYEKRLWRTIRFPEGKLHEDEYTTYRLVFKNSEVCLIPAGLYFYFQNSNGIMLSSWKPKQLDCIQAFNEQYKFFHENDFHRAEQISVSYRIHAIVEYLLALTPDNEYYKEYYPIIKKELGSSLWKYRRSIPYDVFEYEMYRIHPLIIKLLAYIRKIRNAIKK